jgi:hypothetical protein
MMGCWCSKHVEVSKFNKQMINLYRAGYFTHNSYQTFVLLPWYSLPVIIVVTGMKPNDCVYIYMCLKCTGIIDAIFIRMVQLLDINPITTRLRHEYALLLQFHLFLMWQWKLADKTADVKSISRIKHNPLWTCDRGLQKIDWVYTASHCREEVDKVCTRVTLFSYTGRFVMLSVITNIYNKKTKRPTLMELFTATWKLKKVFFWQLEVFDACTMGDSAHIDTIFKFFYLKARISAAAKNIDAPMLTRVWQELE